MPALSKKQQEAMAIALHEPEKLYARNSGMKSMSRQDLHDFAATPRAGLPIKVPTPRATAPHIDRGHVSIRNVATHSEKLRHG